jgi:hypothetical protein
MMLLHHLENFIQKLFLLIFKWKGETYPRDDKYIPWVEEAIL